MVGLRVWSVLSDTSGSLLPNTSCCEFPSQDTPSAVRR